MSLSNIMVKNLVAISSGESVLAATKILTENNFGAVLVGDASSPKGIFTERDLLTKVVSQGKSPSDTKVDDVMTSGLVTINVDKDPEEALRMMKDKHFRHLPVCDEDGKVVGMVGIRTLMEFILNKLDGENESLEAMLSADGFGG